MTRGFLRFMRRNTIALLALFLALGGTTYAASTALIGKNTVASPQVVNGSLAAKDLSKKARAALKGNRGPRGFTGAQGAQGAQGPKGTTGAQGVPGQSATKLFAAVSFNGTLGKNSGATSATRTGTGVYTVVFNTDITNCVYLAVGGTDSGGQIFGYHAYTSRTGTNTVNVQIFDSSDAAFDRSFYLAVFC